LAFSPDGQRLATTSYDGRIGLFALADDTKTLFHAHEGKVASVSFDPSGQSLLSTGEGQRNICPGLRSIFSKLRSILPRLISLSVAAWPMPISLKNGSCADPKSVRPEPVEACHELVE
jgi:WD40 repeat protein